MFAEDVPKSLSLREQFFFCLDVFIPFFLYKFLLWDFFPTGWNSSLTLFCSEDEAITCTPVCSPRLPKSFLLDKKNLDIFETIAHCKLISITIIYFHTYPSLLIIIFQFVSLRGCMFFPVRSLKICHFPKKLFSLKPSSTPLFKLSFLCPSLSLFSLKNPITSLTVFLWPSGQLHHEWVR